MSGSRRPEYLGDPTLGRVMLRPKWILALLLALAVAAVFAWLGRWQMESAIRNATTVIETETKKPLTEVAAPGEAVEEAGAGAVVGLDGSFVPHDFDIITPRVNQGEQGAWVVAHLKTQDPASHLAVALGWAPSVADAEAAIERLGAYDKFEEPMALEGRYLPTESPELPDVDQDPQLMQSLVPGQVINNWAEVDSPPFAGYLVLHPSGAESLLDAAGLDAIDSVAPETNTAVNWLNIFYAIEWIVFAGAAIFMWYRLVRDGWEREHEMKLLLAEAEAERE